MTFSQHATTFFGLPVVELGEGPIDEHAVRVSELDELLEDEDVGKLRALVIGSWHESLREELATPLLEKLVAARKKLVSLRALFVGDVLSEECEASWLAPGDLGPVLAAFPELEELRVRGTPVRSGFTGAALPKGFVLRPKKHAGLRSLAIESAGLPRRVLRDLEASSLPALEHLELWLGAHNEARDVTASDLEPLLSGKLFPRLRSLALRNVEGADEIAEVVASSPLLERLTALDLSLGDLGDAGAEALLASPAVARLERLCIAHHHVSTEKVKALQKLGIGEVDASDPGERYVAVSE